PNGNDAWTGTRAHPNPQHTDGPLASLAGARDAVRRLKERGPLSEPVHVVFAGGTYTLKEPVVFGPQDGGTENAPILYEAAPHAKPVFTGGRRIDGFQPGANGLWTAFI